MHRRQMDAPALQPPPVLMQIKIRHQNRVVHGADEQRLDKLAGAAVEDARSPAVAVSAPEGCAQPGRGRDLRVRRDGETVRWRDGETVRRHTAAVCVQTAVILPWVQQKLLLQRQRRRQHQPRVQSIERTIIWSATATISTTGERSASCSGLDAANIAS